jgi:hypothetical protein
MISLMQIAAGGFAQNSCYGAFDQGVLLNHGHGKHGDLWSIMDWHLQGGTNSFWAPQTRGILTPVRFRELWRYMRINATTREH